MSIDNQDPRSIFLEPKGQVVVSWSDGFFDGEGNVLRADVGANIADREAKDFEASGVVLPQTSRFRTSVRGGGASGGPGNQEVLSRALWEVSRSPSHLLRLRLRHLLRVRGLQPVSVMYQPGICSMDVR